MDNRNGDSVEVSVICLSYNHKQYIAKALESMLSQKTNFAYEIIVHDDCSNDGTVDIIKSFEEANPKIVKAIYQKKNQHSQGIRVFLDICVATARGKYIAVCEGDDYWIDDNKLQIQYEAMEKHPEIDMCASGAVAISADTEQFLYYVNPKNIDTVLSPEEVILGGGRYIATATHFFRKEVFDYQMQFENIIFFDYTNQIRGALRGGILYIAKNLAAYRVLANGSWSSRVEADEDRRNFHVARELDMLKQLDVDTHSKYHDAINRRSKVYSMSDKQDECYKAIIELIKKYNSDIYIWGLGIIGNNFQQYLHKMNIEVKGVCDIKNNNIGQKTEYGYKIYDTEQVLKLAKLIIATNSYAYKDIIGDTQYIGHVVNLQDYI